MKIGHVVQDAGAEQKFVRGVIPHKFLSNQEFDICDCKPLRMLSVFHGEPIFKPCGNGCAAQIVERARTRRKIRTRETGVCQGRVG